MERSLKLFLGLISGLILVFVNRMVSGHDVLGGVFGFILNGLMRVMSFFGIIAVEVVCILLIIESIKFVFKSHKE
jgi:hypothetical protein